MYFVLWYLPSPDIELAPTMAFLKGNQNLAFSSDILVKMIGILNGVDTDVWLILIGIVYLVLFFVYWFSTCFLELKCL